jgi:hypothetical protein
VDPRLLSWCFWLDLLCLITCGLSFKTLPDFGALGIVRAVGYPPFSRDFCWLNELVFCISLITSPFYPLLETLF